MAKGIRTIRGATILFFMSVTVGSGWGQEATRDQPNYETVPGPQPAENPVKGYSIPWGSGGFNLSVGLQALYVDNVFLSHTQEEDDFILAPELNVYFITTKFVCPSVPIFVSPET